MRSTTTILTLIVTAGLAHADAGRGTSNSISTDHFNRVASWDRQGSENNVILTPNLTPAFWTPRYVTGIGWNLTIETVGESWRSEVVFRFYNSDDETLLTLTPGNNDDSPGTTFYTSGGVIDLTDNNIDNWDLRDGPIYLEIYESYDDVEGAIDAYITGTITYGLYVVPSPGALVMAIPAGVFASRRRRCQLGGSPNDP